MQSWNAILREAHNCHTLKYQDNEVQVFPDSSAEARHIQRSLKPLQS